MKKDNEENENTETIEKATEKINKENDELLKNDYILITNAFKLLINKEGNSKLLLFISNTFTY